MLGWEVVPRIGFGDFSVSPHGVGIAAGYFVGTWLTARKARSKGMDDDWVWNAAAVSVIGAVIGARVAYVIGHLSEFDSPVEWFQIWRGGLSIIGAFIGAFTAGYIYTRRKKIDFFEIADMGMPFLALGIAIGRTGDLVIGDHLGKQTSGWWGWQYKGGELISPPPCTYSTPDGCIERGMVVHQTALYDAVWSLVIFGILMLLARKPRNRGFFVLTWASLYSVGRLATDFTRVDKRWLSGLLEPWLGQGLTGSQLTVTFVLAACLFLLAKYRGAPPARKAAPEQEAGPALDVSAGWEAGEEAEEHPEASAGGRTSSPAGGEADRAIEPQAPEPPPRPVPAGPETESKAIGVPAKPGDRPGADPDQPSAGA